MAWETLLSILRENQEERLRAQVEAPIDCPVCATPLQERDGILNCPFGDWSSDVSWMPPQV